MDVVRRCSRLATFGRIGQRKPTLGEGKLLAVAPAGGEGLKIRRRLKGQAKLAAR